MFKHRKYQVKFKYKSHFGVIGQKLIAMTDAFVEFEKSVLFAVDVASDWSEPLRINLRLRRNSEVSSNVMSMSHVVRAEHSENAAILMRCVTVRVCWRRDKWVGQASGEQTPPQILLFLIDISHLSLRRNRVNVEIEPYREERQSTGYEREQVRHERKSRQREAQHAKRASDSAHAVRRLLIR